MRSAGRPTQTMMGCRKLSKYERLCPGRDSVFAQSRINAPTFQFPFITAFETTYLCSAVPGIRAFWSLLFDKTIAMCCAVCVCGWVIRDKQLATEFFQRTTLSGLALFLGTCLLLGQLFFGSWPLWLATGKWTAPMLLFHDLGSLRL